MSGILSTAINILLIILVFGICIMIHEFGHFITAKKSGVMIKEFSIGMGPCLWKKNKGETQYSVRLLPIGGYCAMLGEDEESDDPRAFCNINVWKRILVVVAGVCFNFILAFILSIVLVSMVGINTNTIYQVGENTAAYEAGLQAGDRIIRFNGSRICNFKEISVAMQFYKGDKAIDLVVLRDGEKLKKTVVPKQLENGAYQLGIAGGYTKMENPLQAITYGALEVRYWIKTTYISLGQLVTGGVSVKELSGPVGIGTTMNQVIEEAKEKGGVLDVLVNVINFCILLSANLGVMNLLPIPALDGGRLVFLLIEAIFRKKLPSDKEALVHGIGMVLLLLLMAVVMFHDIWKLFI